MFEKLLKTKAQFEAKGNFLDNFVKLPPEGKCPIRLLPAGSNEDFFVSTRIHRINGANVHCPREYDETSKRFVDVPTNPCPICNYMKDLWAKSERRPLDEKEAMQAEYRAIKARPRFYCNAIARSETDKETGEVKTNVGPKLFSMSQILFNIICDTIMSDPAKPEDITDLAKGRDFIVDVSKKGEWPDFSKSKFAPKTSQAGSVEEVKKWMGELHDLSKFRMVLSQEELVKQLKVHLGELKEEEAATGSPPPTDSSESLVDDDFINELASITK